MIHLGKNGRNIVDDAVHKAGRQIEENTLLIPDAGCRVAIASTVKERIPMWPALCVCLTPPGFLYGSLWGVAEQNHGSMLN